MEFIEKAKIRIAHWEKHNLSHMAEYEKFASELEAAGKDESAACIREMAVLYSLGNKSLTRALQCIETGDDGH